MRIIIPTDNDGYILLKCQFCGTHFKVSASDFEDTRHLNLHCPNCGMTSDNHLTEDVLELAMNMVENYAANLIHDELKKLERKTRNSLVKISAGKKPIQKSERPIHSGIQALEKGYFECCHASAKIKPLLKITGCYCPFCGVKDYAVK